MFNEQELTKNRTSGWFCEFVKKTTEKETSINVLSKFFLHLANTNLGRKLLENVTVFDVGCGTGELSKPFFELLKKHNPTLSYIGAELDPEFAKTTQEKLPDARILTGDAFKILQNLKTQHGTHPNIILASYSLLYAPDSHQTACDLKNTLNPNGLGVFINIAPHSDNLEITQGLNQQTGSTTHPSFLKHFEDLNMEAETLFFNAPFCFPQLDDGLLLELSKAPFYDDTINPHKAFGSSGLETRKVTEFWLQRPLESLSQEQRDGYLQKLKSKLELQNNRLRIVSALTLVLPQGATKESKDELKKIVDLVYRELNESSFAA